MAATKKAAKPKAKTTAKKATPKTKRKSKTSSAPGESAEAHKWLMQSQGVSTEGLPTQVTEDLEDQAEDALATEVAVTVVADGRDAKTGQFVKGAYRGGPGRKKGSRNKLAEAFIADLYDDWLEHGPATIAIVRAEKPDQYLKVAASILPKQMDVRVSEFAELTDDTLDQRLAEMSKELNVALAILQPQTRAN